VIDAVTIVVISVLAFWTFSVEAIVRDSSVSPLVRASWSAYPVLDAVLLALVLRLLLSRRARAAFDVWFGLGVCLWLVADVLYIHLPEDPTAITVMDAAWMLGPVLMARAAWRVHLSEAPVAHPEKVTTGWVAPLLLAVFPLMVPPGLELITHLRGGDGQPLQMLVGMVVVMALALVRIGRLILSEQRAQRELEVARDAALAASEAKSMFLANMSHEIRTPLTTVLVAAGLLNETPMSPVQRKFVDKVHRSGTQLQTLVEGLLDFSRIEAGRAEVTQAEFDPRDVVTDVVDAQLPRADRKGLELDWQIDPGLPQIVIGDRTRVFQVLNNLVENAVKFTEEGRVGLTVCSYNGEGPGGVQFSVTDTGIGIRDEDQAGIFESFTQVDGSAARQYQGTGLGLAICQQVTELLGGTIAVRSELGKGSTFTVRLPLAPQASESRTQVTRGPSLAR
jgi:signal transduction histidine kinase